ncbi:hypothetical protein [Devosia sp. RR2S18]|uniref:hypothetical protein n=1 Tax=Devosia rhizosphaerae TaxID=3049774 RepID=UPI0025420212|nr:hypothetical protein [Devosia sp. RR2S18]WIJ27016.1 hypothetical protein QOV41_09835 [Devosia sp. RR2S18]
MCEPGTTIGKKLGDTVAGDSCGYLGLWQRQNTPPPTDAGAGRILGAVIDSKKADELIAAGGRLSVCLEENTKAPHDSTHTAGAVEAEMCDARTGV